MHEIYLTYSPRRARLVKDAEQRAKDIMQHAGSKPFSWHDDESEELYAWWVNVFGSSEIEHKEAAKALANRWRRLRFKPWRWKERRRIFEQYVRTEGVLTAASGLTTEWR